MVPLTPTTHPSVELTISTNFSHAAVGLEALVQPVPDYRIIISSVDTAHQLDFDLCEVIDKKNRKGTLTFFSGGFASVRKKTN
jgi:hypothetical protein